MHWNLFSFISMYTIDAVIHPSIQPNHTISSTSSPGAITIAIAARAHASSDNHTVFRCWHWWRFAKTTKCNLSISIWALKGRKNKTQKFYMNKHAWDTTTHKNWIICICSVFFHFHFNKIVEKCFNYAYFSAIRFCSREYLTFVQVSTNYNSHFGKFNQIPMLHMKLE